SILSCKTQHMHAVIKSAPDSSKPNWVWLLLPLALLCFVSIVRLQWPELSHGDDWSDSSVLFAGENFSRLGFAPSHGLPVFWPRADHVPPSVRPDSKEWNALSVFGTYTRLPPLHNWISGLLHPLFGDNILPYRIIAVSFSFVGLIAFWAFVKILSASERLAGIAVILYISNPYFIANFDSLHQHAYMDAFRNVALLGLAMIVWREGRQRIIGLIITWVSLLLLSLTTYEYLPLFTILLTGLAIYLSIRGQRMVGVTVLLLGSAIAVGLLIHFALVAGFYGGVQVALQDRIANAAQRISGNENLLGSAGAFSWLDWWNLVLLRFLSQASILGLPCLLLTMVFGMASWRVFTEYSRSRLRVTWGSGLALLVASSIWYAVMPAHCVDHAGLSFLQKFLIPGISLLLTSSYESLLRLMEATEVKAMVKNTIAVLVIGMVSWIGISSSELPLTAAKITAEKEFEKVRDCLVQLKPRLVQNDYIATNIMRPTWMMMHYLGTRAIAINDPKMLNASSVMPKIFLLVPTNDPGTQALADKLQKTHRVIGFCDNQRLPFYIFESTGTTP
ncbi:MAG: hypothetical protein ORN51_13335, partial [Akkermansiaceae bacterium]|nr:hypothetical protein [Akkermansiaceae bacterium]